MTAAREGCAALQGTSVLADARMRLHRNEPGAGAPAPRHQGRCECTCVFVRRGSACGSAGTKDAIHECSGRGNRPVSRMTRACHDPPRAPSCWQGPTAWTKTPWRCTGPHRQLGRRARRAVPGKGPGRRGNERRGGPGGDPARLGRFAAREQGGNETGGRMPAEAAAMRAIPGGPGRCAPRRATGYFSPPCACAAAAARPGRLPTRSGRGSGSHAALCAACGHRARVMPAGAAGRQSAAWNAPLGRIAIVRARPSAPWQRCARAVPSRVQVAQPVHIQPPGSVRARAAPAGARSDGGRRGHERFRSTRRRRSAPRATG